MNFSILHPIPISKSSRPGRYRKVLVDPASLVSVAPKLENLFQDLDVFRSQGKLTDAEFLSYGLIALLACRRPQAFQTHINPMQRHDSKLSEPKENIPASVRLSDFWELTQRHSLPLHADCEVLRKDSSVLDFIAGIRFRGLPDSARLALLAWLQDRYPLTLYFHIPSAMEVFELQKQGNRCVTLLRRSHELTAWHHERDAIGFLVHDLIHAHEFYDHPQRAKQQIGFYRWLDGLQSNARLQQLKRESPAFVGSWDYVLSDMNSYCGHLLQTLHAAFTLHAPSGAGEVIWKAVVENSDLGAAGKKLFLKINTSEWGEPDFLELEALLNQASGF